MRTSTVFLVCAFCGIPLCRGQSPDSADRTATPNPVTRQFQYKPLTEKERLAKYLKDTVSPLSLMGAAASAGLGQWRHRPEEWQEGSYGYGQRIASAYAEHMVRSTLAFAGASALHEDVWYVPSGQSGVGERTRYALTSAFMARGRDGARHVSIAKLGAFAGAAVISRIWQPHSTNSLRSAGVNFGTEMGVSAGFDVLREFWPRRQ